MKSRLDIIRNELSLDNCVQFSFDFLPIEDLPELILTADLAVVTYRQDIFTDGILPTKLMEYSVLGIPAIAARTSVISSYFDDTMVEFFAPEDLDELTSAIRKLYFDEDRRKQLSENIRKFDEQYRWDVLKMNYVNQVKELITG